MRARWMVNGGATVLEYSRETAVPIDVVDIQQNANRESELHPPKHYIIHFVYRHEDYNSQMEIIL